jgi:hypothetical protein
LQVKAARIRENDRAFLRAAGRSTRVWPAGSRQDSTG